MEKTVEKNILMFCLTLLYITSIYSQPLESTTKTSPEVYNEKKEILIATSTIPNLSINSSSHIETSTDPSLLHNVQTTKVEAPTYSVSTFPPLIRKTDNKIYFPTNIETSMYPISDTESVKTIESKTNFGISTHTTNEMITSTHPPLIYKTKPVKPIEDGNLLVLPLTALSSIIPIKIPYNKETSKDVALTDDGQSILSAESVAISKVTALPPGKISTTISFEKSTYPLPTRNPNLGISIHPPNYIKTSTHPPLIHDMASPKPIEVSTISSFSTHPPLISEMESTKGVEATSTIKSTEANVFSFEVTTYPPPTRNPNLGILTHHSGTVNSTPLPLPLDVSQSDSDNSNSKNTTTMENFNNKKCAFAIVGCCSTLASSHEKCFEMLGCPGPFWGKGPCEKSILSDALKFVKEYYKNGE